MPRVCRPIGQLKYFYKFVFKNVFKMEKMYHLFVADSFNLFIFNGQIIKYQQNKTELSKTLLLIGRG